MAAIQLTVMRLIRGGMNTNRSLKRPEGGWDSHSNDISAVIPPLCNNPGRKSRKSHVERKLKLPINFRKPILVFTEEATLLLWLSAAVVCGRLTQNAKPLQSLEEFVQKMKPVWILSVWCSTFTLRCSELIWEPADKLQLCQIMLFGMFASEACHLGEVAMFSVTLFFCFKVK